MLAAMTVEKEGYKFVFLKANLIVCRVCTDLVVVKGFGRAASKILHCTQV